MLLLRMSWLVSAVTDAAAFEADIMPLMLMFWCAPTPTPPPPPPPLVIIIELATEVLLVTLEPVLLELRRDDPTIGDALPGP